MGLNSRHNFVIPQRNNYVAQIHIYKGYDIINQCVNNSTLISIWLKSHPHLLPFIDMSRRGRCNFIHIGPFRSEGSYIFDDPFTPEDP